MTVDTISHLAYSGTPPDSALPHEWLLWYRLRDIYESVRTGHTSKRIGSLAKQDAVDSYQTDLEQFERNVLFWKRIEGSGNRFAHEPNVDNALRFYEDVYGISVPTSMRAGEGDTQSLPGTDASGFS